MARFSSDVGGLGAPKCEVSRVALAAFGKPRGRPKAAAAKVAVKLRLDPDVIEGFKAGGPGWQTRINTTLKDALAKRAG